MINLINLEYIILFQEFNQFGKAVNKFMEEYANLTLPDLHIGGWTAQNGLISYPEGYNYDSNKGQIDSKLPLSRTVHIELVNVSDSCTLLRNGFFANPI